MRNKAIAIMLAVSAAALIGWLAAWTKKPGAVQASPSISPATGINPDRRVEGPSKPEPTVTIAAAPSINDPAADLAKSPLRDLVAMFDLTGDRRYFDAAKKHHGNDPSFLVVDALASKAPDASALAALEAAQPDNSLPHILRAGMHASGKNWKGMNEELERALSKEDLSMNARERKASVLDLLMADPNLPTENALTPHVDASFYGKLESIERALHAYPDLFGGSTKAATMGVGLATRLRSMGAGGDDYQSRLCANGIELDVLRNVDQDVPYGDTGMTVLQRILQLNAEAPETGRLGELFNKMYQPTMDPITRKQFLARVRADGEIAALNWFEMKLAEKVGRP